MRFVRQRSGPPEDLDLDPLREAIGEYPLSLAVLFGSHATDTVHSLSDLDVAVAFDDDVARERKLRLLDELTVAIQRATAIEAVDIVDLDTVGPAVGYAVLRDGILLRGDPDDALDREAAFLVRKLDFRHVKREWDAALEARVEEGRFGRS